MRDASISLRPATPEGLDYAGEARRGGAGIVLALTLGLTLLWLALWPITRFLDTHPAFTDDVIASLPVFGFPLRALTTWAEPLLSGWQQQQTAGLLVGWYVLAFVLHIVAVRQLRSAGRGLARWVLGTAYVFQALFFLQPVLFTSDLFSYASYGEMQWYGFNPYTTVPLDVESSRITWLIPAIWRAVPSIYGPLWNLMSIPVAAIAGPDPVVSALAYKLIANAFHAVSVLVIWRSLARSGTGTQASGTALYAWNPLVLIEFVTNGHNDAVMAGLLVVALALVLAGRPRLALVPFAASVAVKYTSVLVVPFWLMLWARRAASRRGAALRFFGGGALIGLLVLACYGWYFEGLDTFGPVLNWLGAPMYANTIAEPLLGWSIQALSPLLWWLESPEAGITSGFKWLVRIGFAAYLVLELARVRTFRDATAATARAFTTFLLAVNSWVMPWYYLWAVAVVPFLGWQSMTTRWAVLTAATASGVIYFFHFGERTVPVEAIHLLLVPSAAVGAVRLIGWLQPIAQRVNWPSRPSPLPDAATQDAARP